MKLIHVPFCFYPDSVGGTEIYVDALARRQQGQGNEIVIAAPGERDDAYPWDGLTVRRFAVTEPIADLRDLYGEGDPSAARAFGRILHQERPDLVHLHAFTRGVSVRIVREAKQRGIPVVFSYHTPTVSCQRGTLLRWGSEVCDGILDLHTCARCALHGHGLNRQASQAIGRLSPSVGRLFSAIGVSGGVWTALRMTELVELRQASFRALMSEADHVVALCHWVQELLLRNGVPAEKITVSRQGLCQELGVVSQRTDQSSPLRIAFLGRLDATKGAHILIQALRGVPHLSAHLDVYGVVQGQAGASYLHQLKRLANGDPRINFHRPMPSDEVISRLQEYNVLAVPSQWLETGPLVVLEAFAAGIPVLGSNLGGIPELVMHGSNGLLVESQSIESWSDALRSLCEDRDLLPRLRSGIRPPRSMRVVAKEMSELYSTVLQERIAIESMCSGRKHPLSLLKADNAKRDTYLRSPL
jgi:glycosyltransferase involved in cell wall biosynthesis